MITIEIENSVFQALETKAVGFGVTPNDVIKRLLSEEVKNGTIQQETPPPVPANESPTDMKTHPLVALVKSPEYECRDCKWRYFGILRFLYKSNPEEFVAKLDNFMKGSRVQISKSKELIEKSGCNTWPQILDETPYWVLTNLSNQRKRDILGDVLRILRYPNDVIALVIDSIPNVGRGDNDARRNEARLLRKYS